MLTLKEYLPDPCGASSIPLWKARRIQIPETMRILHHRDYTPELSTGFRDTVYFRLKHDLTCTPAPSLPGYTLCTATTHDFDSIISIINRSYADLRITIEDVRSYTQTPVYAPQLWVMATDVECGDAVGCGLADFDRETGELILEWIQVLPQYRRRGIGRAIVMELLHRKPECSRFATVSGKVDSPSCPEALYRGCGFSGGDYWHILTPLEV